MSLGWGPSRRCWILQTMGTDLPGRASRKHLRLHTGLLKKRTTRIGEKGQAAFQKGERGRVSTWMRRGRGNLLMFCTRIHLRTWRATAILTRVTASPIMTTLFPPSPHPYSFPKNSEAKNPEVLPLPIRPLNVNAARHTRGYQALLRLGSHWSLHYRTRLYNHLIEVVLSLLASRPPPHHQRPPDVHKTIAQYPTLWTSKADKGKLPDLQTHHLARSLNPKLRSPLRG